MTYQKKYTFSFFKDLYLFIFRGREKERERNINVWLLLVHPLLGTWPATQACALTGNQTSHPLVHRLVLNPLSHTSQGRSIYFLNQGRYFSRRLGKLSESFNTIVLPVFRTKSSTLAVSYIKMLSFFLKTICVLRKPRFEFWFHI